MQNILVDDIILHLFDYFPFQTLGRLSLASKESLEETWFLAPSITMTNPVALPFNTIFQSTGNNLRHLDLFGGKDYPAVIQHLADNCPNLVSLSMPDNMLTMYKKQDVHLAKVLARLKHLELRRTDATSYRVMQRLCDVLKSIDTPSRLTDLTIGCRIDEPARSPLVDVVRQFPKLDSLSAPIDSFDVSLIQQLCDACPSLKQLRRAQFHILDMDRFKASDAATLLETNIGFNITINENESPFLWNLTDRIQMESTPFLAWLQSIGLKQRIDEYLFIHMILKKPDYLSTLSLVELGNNPVLPSMDQLRSSPDIEVFWDQVLRSAPAAVFRQVISYLGPPPAKGHSSLLPTILSQSSADAIADYVPAFVELCDFDLVKFVSVPHFDPLVYDAFREPSAEGLRWLLQHVPEAQVREYLSHVDGENAPIFLKYLKQDLPHADIVVEHYNKDASFFRFANTDHTTQATSACIRLQRMDRLERIVEAAGGFQNITPATRAGGLWTSLLALMQISSSPFHAYWLKNLEEHPEPQPKVFSVCSAEPLANFLSVFRTDPFVVVNPLKTIIPTLDKYLHAIQDQIATINADLLLSFFRAIVRLPAHEASQVEFITQKLFPPFANALAKTGQSTCIPLLKEIADMWSSFGSISQLFRICAQLDFAEENKQNHATISADIAAEMRYRLDVMISRGTSKFAEDCLDCLNADDLNKPTEYSKVNLMDMVLIQENACRFDNISELIVKLAQRGGRITAGENSRSRYARDALVAYCDTTGEELDPDRFGLYIDEETPFEGGVWTYGDGWGEEMLPKDDAPGNSNN